MLRIAAWIGLIAASLGTTAAQATTVRVGWEVALTGSLGTGTASGTFGVFDVDLSAGGALVPLANAPVFPTPGVSLFAQVQGFEPGIDGSYPQAHLFQLPGPPSLLIQRDASTGVISAGLIDGIGGFDGPLLLFAIAGARLELDAPSGIADLAEFVFSSPRTASGTIVYTVPEPAGLQALLGGLALVFAASRRRESAGSAA